jgi:cation-transporting ATPase 13A3/4/5
MVFDKTGTLTEDGLQILGMQALTSKNKFLDFVNSIKKLLVVDVRKSLLDHRVLFNEAMACCHAITYINKVLVGDPLEIKMFENTDWVLDETNTISNSICKNEIVQAYVRPRIDAGFKENIILKSYEENS